MNESFSYNSIKMLTGKLIGLAKACQTKPKTDNTDRIILYILTELGHADFLADDNEKIKLLEDIIEGGKKKNCTGLCLLCQSLRQYLTLRYECFGNMSGGYKRYEA